MTKIAYFSPYFWPEAIGSAPYCTDIARRLAEEGHDVNVWAFRPYYPRANLFPQWQDGSRDEETIDGLLVYRFRGAVEPTKIGNVDVPGSLVGSDQATVSADRMYLTSRDYTVEPVTGAFRRTTVCC